MKNKKLIFAVGALVLVVAIMAGVYAMTRQEAVQGGKEITVTVVHGDGSEKVFTCVTQEEYLGPVILAENIAQGEEGPYGLNIHTVDGETASWEVNQSYWAIFIGADYATTGADGVVLTDGGEYSLVYTIG